MIFQNHEVNKLVITNKPIFLLVLALFIGGLCIVEIRTNKENKFLDRTHTDELRGFAILLVIVGHFSIHALNTPIMPSAGALAVGLFLTLSGFGLTTSYIRKGISKNYIKSRLSRVWMPYFFVTLVWFILDTIVGTKHSIAETILTFFGININVSWDSVDFNMWYITYIYFFYMMFYIIFRFIKDNKLKQVLLYISGIIIYILTYYKILPPIWADSIFNFALGSTIAFYYDKIAKLLRNKVVLVCLLLISFIAYYFSNNMPHSVESIFFTITIILVSYLFYYFGIYTRFLLFLGTISYELYLIHGPLMYRYDFILIRGPLEITFPVYLIMIFVLGKILNNIFKRINVKTFMTTYGKDLKRQ